MHVRSRLYRWKFCSSTQPRETKRECTGVNHLGPRASRPHEFSIDGFATKGEALSKRPNRFDRTSEKLHTLLFGGCETAAPQNTSANNIGDTERTELRHGVHGVNHPVCSVASMSPLRALCDQGLGSFTLCTRRRSQLRP